MKDNYAEVREQITALFSLIDNKAFKNININLLVVLKALNKQIPNAPIKVDRNKASANVTGYNFQTEYDCPCCRKVNIRKGQKYCDGCGQALKWESEVTDNDR